MTVSGLCAGAIGGMLACAVFAAHADQHGACHAGAYRNGAGQLLTLEPSQDDKLRFYLLDGQSGQLTPARDGTHTAGPGWNGSSPTVATAKLGQCDSGEIEFNLKGGPGGRWTKVPLRIEETTFSSDGLTLTGRWVEPADGKPRPAVVFVHGSAATPAIDRVPWQWILPAEGISMFVFDKRGTGRSQGMFTQDFELLAQDVVAAVIEARRIGGANIARLGLAGFSQGGWVAPLAATRTPVDFVLVGYGVVGSPLEQDAWQVRYELQQLGFDQRTITKAQEVTRATGEFVASGYSGGREQLNALQVRHAADPWLKKIEGQYSGLILRSEIERARAESPGVIWNYDSMRVLRSLRIPQLWIMAGADSVAPSAPSIERLTQLQRERVPIDIAIFPNTDHGMGTFETLPDGTRRKLRVADGYFPLQIDWIKGPLARTYGSAQLQLHD